ncbi:MAG TPA: alpha-L-fucosidase [Agriterribacter sp.]|nr:alpha-L-fucosidase [Agriterribacter sp.]
MKKKGMLFLAMVMLFSGIVAQHKTDKKILDDFMDKRFGMFIHFGPVSLRGTEIGWSRGHQVTVEDYDNLYKEFNPVLFNANEWVKTAKDAGMKYLTITAKHHDGFCLWPSAYTSYDIMSSPFQRDIVGELAAACKKQDIKFCIYFTVLDWHDPNYAMHNLGDTIPDPKADMKAFVQNMKSELTELITKYHPYMLWFDGNWEKPWTHAYGVEVYDHIKKLDPKVIVNNRLGKGDHKVMSPETVGDYATPEQQIGQLNMQDPWESCITICKQWAWKPNDKMKTLKECLETLVRTASGNGNLLFNVGPMMDGRMEQRQIDALKQMGVWLSKYGESIYGTRGGPYVPDSLYSATRKDNKVFVHLFNSEVKEITLPELPSVNVLRSSIMNGGNLALQHREGKYSIKLPDQLPDANSNVLVLELDKSAINIPITK